MLALQKLVAKLLPLLWSEIRGKGFVLALALVGVLLAWTNYQPGTWLSGWDTLHPEFNFGLYFKRIFFGVWQEHQGLGAVASQAHASELPRIILYYLLSLFSSDPFLRYFYFFLTIIFGTLGVYFFLERVVFQFVPTSRRQIVSFGGSLVYFLNLGVLQHYYVPLEMFATHFATLPWLFLFATQYINDGKKKNLLLFSIVTVFSTSIAHTPTLFFAYFIGLLLYVGVLTFWRIKKNIYRGLLIVLTTIALNSFWLLPSVYFVVNNGQDIGLSKIHSQFSDKAFLTGKKFGTIADTALLKNFLFDWGDYDAERGEFVDLFDEWDSHLQTPAVLLVGHAVFLLVVFGLILSLLKKRKHGLAVLPVFIISFLAISNNVPGISSLFHSLRESSPLFREVLRFPFTKFSILLMFSYAVYFAIALNFLVKKLGRRKLVVFCVPFIILAALFYYMLPAFSGNLMSSTMKAEIPREYFSVFERFEKKEEFGRVAPFPVHTFWGWVYHTWGYEGAGFRWFGIRQPILDREFDRWSSYNENYYWEISYATYSKNLSLFENVLEKYQIQWLLVDESVINPSSAKTTYLDELSDMLVQSNKVSLSQEFGHIRIYEVDLETPLRDFVFLAENLPVIEPAYKWNNYDVGFEGSGGYISNPTTHYQLPTTTYYPFRSLFTGKTQEDLEFEIEDKDDHFLFKKTIPENLAGYHLDVPLGWQEQLVWVDPSDLGGIEYKDPEIYFDGWELQVKVPKVYGYFSAELNDASKAGGEKSFFLPNLPHKFAYLINVESKNISGRPILLWMENLNSQRADLETYLPKGPKMFTSYFVQPPMEEDGLGYTLHFDNVSIGDEKAVNEVGKVTVNPIPYQFLVGLALRSGDSQSEAIYHEAGNVYHPNSSYYEIEVKENSTLVLSQAYHKGWIAFTWDGFIPKKINEHVLVNNWANGWVLGEGGKIRIIFWPQLLEYAGFILAGGFLLLLVLRRKND